VGVGVGSAGRGSLVSSVRTICRPALPMPGASIVVCLGSRGMTISLKNIIGLASNDSCMCRVSFSMLDDLASMTSSACRASLRPLCPRATFWSSCSLTLDVPAFRFIGVLCGVMLCYVVLCGVRGLVGHLPYFDV